jgi:drug/metabolite transporter (DMT)-like permease
MELDNRDHARILRRVHANPHLLLFLTSLFWAGHWIVARAVVPYASPAGMAFWRWVAAIVLLAPFAAPALVREWPALRRAWRPILFFGTCGTVVYNIIGYHGIRESTATNAVMFQSLTPAVIPFFGWLLFRERIRAATAAGLALSFAGVLAIISRLDFDVLFHFRTNPGDLWLLGNVALWALYTACMRWTPRGLDPFAFMLAVMLAGMVTGLPAYLVDVAMGGRVEFNRSFVLGTLYLAALPSILCYVMWNNAVAMVGPAKAGVYLHLIPLLGAAMAIVFLGERLHLYHAVGLVLILGGVWLASRRHPN